MKDKKLRTPIRIMKIWLVVTMFLFCFGPLNYNCNKLYAILYMCFFLIVSNYFYFLGTHVKREPSRKRFRFDLNQIIVFSLYYSLILSFLFFLEAIK